MPDTLPDAPFTNIKYAFAELCKGEKIASANKLLDIVKKFGGDVERVERNRPARVESDPSWTAYYIDQGIRYLLYAIELLDEIEMREASEACRKVAEGVVGKEKLDKGPFAFNTMCPIVAQHIRDYGPGDSDDEFDYDYHYWEF